MDDPAIVALLRSGPIPDSSEALLRTHERAAALAERRRTRLRRVGLGLLAAVVLALTPPVQSLAEDLGHLVGIGGEPTFDQSASPTLPADGPGVVVAAGHLPGGRIRYELVASRNTGDPSSHHKREPVQVDPLPGERSTYSCLNLDLPSREHPSQVNFEKQCVDRPPSALSVSGFSEANGALGPKAEYFFEGEVDGSVARVEATYGRQGGERVGAPVIFGRIDPSTAAAIGDELRWGRFFIYLPSGADGTADPRGAQVPSYLHGLTVTAYDGHGNIVRSLNHVEKRFRANEVTR